MEIREIKSDSNCIFCNIVSGKIQSAKIYDDDLCIIILDIHPANPGHALLIPKNHYSSLFEIPDEEFGYYFKVLINKAEEIRNKLRMKGFNIIISEGEIAGQHAPHIVMHIIPREEDDKISFVVPSNKISEEQINDFIDQIKNK